jgi:hypothetical protein
MPDVAHFDKDEAWSITAEVRVNDVLVDPGGISATARKPDGTLVPYAFPGVNIAKDSVGVYTVSAAGDAVGTWELEVVTTGVGAGRSRHEFVIDPRWPQDLLDPHALCTLTDVELVLDRLGSEGTLGEEEDDRRWIATLINEYSQRVQDYTGRQFMPAPVGSATHLYSYDGYGMLLLSPYEARTITAVTLWSNMPVSDQVPLGIGYTLGQRYAELEPPDKSPEQTYLRLLLPEYRRLRPITVSVTGTWGAGVVPDPVSRVTAAEAANAYLRGTRSNEPELTGPDVGAYELSESAKESLDAFASKEWC